MIAELAEAAKVEAARQQRIETKLDQMLAELGNIRASLPPRMLSVADAATALGGISTQTVTAMAKRGELASRRAGRRLLIDAASLHGKSREDIAHLARRARAGQ